MEDDRPISTWLFVAILIVGFVVFFFWPAKVKSEEAFRIGERANVSLCRGWINLECSCSHRSCWEARPDEFASLGNGRWIEKSSGQVKQQTGWSKDGTFIACAWRPGLEIGVQYYVGKGANISCVYPPMPAF